jgi:hypothetical protein
MLDKPMAMARFAERPVCLHEDGNIVHFFPRNLACLR